MERTWTISLLGGLRAARGNDSVDRFVTQKAAHLLAYLALVPRMHPREEIVEMLWPDIDPAASRLRLNQVVATLRRQFGESGRQTDGLFLTDRWTVGLNSKRFRTDIEEFEALAKAERFEEAAELYEGELLPGVYDDWAVGERTRLIALYASVLEQLRRQLRQQGRLDEAVAVGIKLVALDPFQEESHLGLIRLYGLQGRTSLALEQFERMESALTQMGSRPSETAKRVIERIRRGDVPEIARRTVAEPVREEVRRHLPVRLTRFFGREAELAQIDGLLENRLVTLIGPGGVGKTQLALEALHRAGKGFGAVHFAALADIGRAEEVADAILAALSQPPGGLEGLERVFRRWERSLLLLDNLEHLPEATPLIGRLLESVPGLTILATSRARLGLPGERLIEVEPLPVAPESATLEELLAFPSVQLFLERAREIRADFALTARNREAVQAVCARLEGLPLALELAAGWASTMSPSQMLAGLDHRFEFLKSRRRTRPVRHRSLQAAIDYGYALLEEPERRLLGALSIFHGGFTDEAASAVAQVPTISGSLADLVERSMVKAGPSGDGLTVRFSMLESLREFGLGQLDEQENRELRQRHASVFAADAELAARERNGPRQSMWLRRLGDDHRNLLAALEWLEAEDPERALGMASDLDWYWEAKGHLRLGREAVERLLKREGVSAVQRAKALNSLTWLVWNQNDLGEARRIGLRALSAWRKLGGSAGLQQAAYNLGVVAFRKQDLARSRKYLGQALAWAEAEGDLSGVSRALLLFGNVARVERDLTTAKSFYERSLHLEQELGNQIRTCFILSNLGGIAADEDEHDLSARYYERCVELSRETGHRTYEGVFLYNLGTARTRQGRFDEARQPLREGLRIMVDSLRDHLAFRIVWTVAFLASKVGDVESAATLWGISVRMVEWVPLEPTDSDELRRGEEEAFGVEVRTEAAYIAARSWGRSLGNREAIEFTFRWLGPERSRMS